MSSPRRSPGSSDQDDAMGDRDRGVSQSARGDVNWIRVHVCAVNACVYWTAVCGVWNEKTLHVGGRNMFDRSMLLFFIETRRDRAGL